MFTPSVDVSGLIMLFKLIVRNGITASISKLIDFCGWFSDCLATIDTTSLTKNSIVIIYHLSLQLECSLYIPFKHSHSNAITFDSSSHSAVLVYFLLDSCTLVVSLPKMTVMTYIERYEFRSDQYFSSSRSPTTVRNRSRFPCLALVLL